MVRTQRMVSRRAIVGSGLTCVAAIAGVGLSRLPTAGREFDVSGTPSTASPASTPVVEAIEVTVEAIGLRFSPAAISIPAHTPVRILFTNRSRVYHDFVIPQLGRRTARIGPDESSELLISAEPGTFIFYCSIQSHHQAGMEGTITVEQHSPSARPVATASCEPSPLHSLVLGAPANLPRPPVAGAVGRRG